MAGKIDIKYDELEYVPKHIVVETEEEADEIYQALKKMSGIRNLRRI